MTGGPCPPPYWYHGELDVDGDELPALMGRQLQVGTRKYYQDLLPVYLVVSKYLLKFYC